MGGEGLEEGWLTLLVFLQELADEGGDRLQIPALHRAGGEKAVLGIDVDVEAL